MTCRHAEGSDADCGDVIENDVIPERVFRVARQFRDIHSLRAFEAQRLPKNAGVIGQAGLNVNNRD